MKRVHYFAAGNIERWARNRPYAVWRPGYSEVTATGHTAPWVLRREAQRDARARGGIAKFHPTQEAARAALLADQ